MIETIEQDIITFYSSREQIAEMIYRALCDSARSDELSVMEDRVKIIPPPALVINRVSNAHTIYLLGNKRISPGDIVYCYNHRESSGGRIWAGWSVYLTFDNLLSLASLSEEDKVFIRMKTPERIRFVDAYEMRKQLNDFRT